MSVMVSGQYSGRWLFSLIRQNKVALCNSSFGYGKAVNDFWPRFGPSDTESLRKEGSIDVRLTLNEQLSQRKGHLTHSETCSKIAARGQNGCNTPLRICQQTIAKASDGFDCVGPLAELLSEASDMGIDGPGVDVRLVSPCA